MVYNFPATVTETYEAKFIMSEFKIKSVNISGSITIGHSLTFTADVTGGVLPLKYAFCIVGDGKVYYKSSAYTAANSFTYTPNQKGEYTVIVYAADNVGRKCTYTKVFKVS